MSEKDEVVDPSMYCLKCSYPLEGLSSSRCPECGLAFDPVDVRSFAHERAGVGRGLANIGATVLGFMVPTLAVHVLIIQKVGIGDIELYMGWYAWTLLWQACGPLGYRGGFLPYTEEGTSVMAFAAFTWVAWMFLISWTRLRRLPYTVHFLIGFVWGILGAPSALWGV